MVMFPVVIMAMTDDDDRAYMEWLYRQYYRLMYSTAWKFFRDKAIVDDIVSDGCLALIKNIQTIKTLECSKLRAYIVSTIRNTSLNYFDKQQRMDSHVTSGDWEAVSSLSDETDIERKVVLEDELMQVWKAIMQLSTKEQQIMRMKYVLDMTDEEIARNVGLSANSIRKYVSRAREHIKAIVYAE